MKTSSSWSARQWRVVCLLCMTVVYVGLVAVKATSAPTVPRNRNFPLKLFKELKRISRLKRSSRYMEQNCEPTTYPWWEGLPLQKCTYKAKRYDKLAKIGPEEC